MPLTRPPSRLRTSLRASTLDGSFHAAMVGFGETYFPAFALFLGATPFQVGLLATLPILVGSAFQLLAPRLSPPVESKRWVTGSAALQASIFVPAALLTFPAARQTDGFAILMSLVCVYWALALGGSTVWSAWMGRMIPQRIRSRYFARRNTAVQALLFLSMVAAGSLLHAGATGLDAVPLAFALIFLVAGACRLASSWFLGRQHDVANNRLPPRSLATEPRSEPRPYGKLVLLASALTGSVHFAAPYFTPFMLDELRLSYAEFTLLNAAVALSRMISSAYWGEIARTYGNRRALQVSAVLVVPLPALWLVSEHTGYLLVLQLLAGFAWAGYELTLFLNFFDCTDEANRSRVLSLYNLGNGAAMVIGTLLGGLLLRHFGSTGYFHVFLASAVLRALSVLFLARRAGLRRPGEHTFENVFLRVISFRPGQGPRLRPLILNGDGAKPARPSARRPERDAEKNETTDFAP